MPGHSGLVYHHHHATFHLSSGGVLSAFIPLLTYLLVITIDLTIEMDPFDVLIYLGRAKVNR